MVYLRGHIKESLETKILMFNKIIKFVAFASVVMISVFPSATMAAVGDCEMKISFWKGGVDQGLSVDIDSAEFKDYKLKISVAKPASGSACSTPIRWQLNKTLYTADQKAGPTSFVKEGEILNLPMSPLEVGISDTLKVGEKVTYEFDIQPKANSEDAGKKSVSATLAIKKSGGVDPDQSNTNKVVSVPVIVPQITNPFGTAADTVPGIVNRAINVLLALIVIAAVVVIIVAGFRMVAGGSNPEQIKKAKSTIAWAFAGMLVAFMSFAIVQIIQRLL